MITAWALEKSFEEPEIAEDISVDAQNYETWLAKKDEIGQFYDARVTLEKSHALEEIERLELFIAQAGMKIEEMETQIQSGTSVSFPLKNILNSHSLKLLKTPPPPKKLPKTP